jgi:hypothetical protein
MRNGNVNFQQAMVVGIHWQSSWFVEHKQCTIYLLLKWSDFYGRIKNNTELANGSNEMDKCSVVQLLETKFGNYVENVQGIKGTFLPKNKIENIQRTSWILY